jgi:hypothetical protein
MKKSLRNLMINLIDIRDLQIIHFDSSLNQSLNKNMLVSRIKHKSK